MTQLEKGKESLNTLYRLNFSDQMKEEIGKLRIRFNEAIASGTAPHDALGAELNDAMMKELNEQAELILHAKTLFHAKKAKGAPLSADAARMVHEKSTEAKAPEPKADDKPKAGGFGSRS